MYKYIYAHNPGPVLSGYFGFFHFSNNHSDISSLTPEISLKKIKNSHHVFFLQLSEPICEKIHQRIWQ